MVGIKERGIDQTAQRQSSQPIRSALMDSPTMDTRLDLTHLLTDMKKDFSEISKFVMFKDIYWHRSSVLPLPLTRRQNFNLGQIESIC